jgi:hypothetical protein
VFHCDPRSHAYSPLCLNLWVRRVVSRVLVTQNPSTFGTPGRGLWCVSWICFDMGDDCPERLRLRADFEARRQGRLYFLATLEVMGQGRALAGGVYCFGGFEALFASLRHVDWPWHFRPDTPACFNGLSDPVEFLWQYIVAIRAAGGDGHVMANWFPIAIKDEPRRWILGLPLGSVSSWRDLCERFLDKYAPLGA